MTRPRDEWIPILRAHQVPSAPVQTRDQFIEDPQVRHLGLRREIDDPVLGPTLQVGVPIHLVRTPGDISGPPPMLDRSNSALPALIDEAQRRRKETSSQRPQVKAGSGPLAGIVVIDFSSYIAGSYGPMLLGQMGATVIKVENRDGDSLRPISGFRGWNQNKRDLVLDVRTPQGLEIVHDLVRKADVFMENFRPGRTRDFGIGYDQLSAINPRLVYVSVTGFGSSGPDYDRPGLDPLVQSASGSYAAIGGVGHVSAKRPDFPRHPIYMNVPLADYGAATISALGCLLALRARQVTGVGQLCETSLMHAVMAMQAGEFIFYKGRPNLEDSGGPESRGTSALHRAYECQDGQWLYLSISDEAAWDALRSLSAAVPPLSFVEARLETEDGGLADALERYFAAPPSSTLFDTLVGRGITVARVLHLSQLFEDPQVVANELTVELEEPEIGIVSQVGHLAKFSDGGPSLSSAPRLGEHSERVLAEFLGYGADRIAALRSAGVIFQE